MSQWNKKLALARANNRGFSLVELIVVIAIMAILVGVAVPVYTSYITKSQKASDTQLVDEIKRAVEIKLIADAPEDFAGGVVITLSKDGAEVKSGSDADQAFITQALSETFGDDWASTLTLKYDGWESGTAQTVVKNYTGSSYEGNEAALLSQIQNLSSALAILPDTAFGSGGYSAFLQENEATAGVAKGNAAALYVAQCLSGEDTNAEEIADILSTVITDIVKNGNTDAGNIGSLTNACGSQGAMLATVYAAIEGFALSSDSEENQALLEKLHSVDVSNCETPDQIFNAVIASFSELDPESSASLIQSFADYADSELESDIAAYVSVMQAVNASKDSILSQLNSTECYTDGTLLNKLNAFLTVGQTDIADGQLAVVINASEDGTYHVLAYPIDY